jgi:tetratricopeptide (TPR) repeat protein
VIEVLGTQCGSGLLLAERLVLTAAHLLVPAGRVLEDERSASEVAVRLPGGGGSHAARCVWARYEGSDRGLDAALLEITSPGWRPPAVAVVRPGRLAGSAEVRVHAFGFPDAAVQAGVAELSPVTGVVHTDSGAWSGRPEIVVGGEPEREPGGVSLWAGLSGAPVFAAPDGMTSEVLLGVIVSDPAVFASRRLRMIPAPAILADPAAAAIIGRHYGSLAVIPYPEPGPGAQLPGLPEVRYSLPPDTPAFTGRDEELDRVTAAMAGASGAGGVVTVGAIDGMPGVGKTALAVHAAYILRDRFPDRQLFISLHGHTPGREPVPPEEALAGLLACAGVNTRLLPGDLDGRAAMWRDKMAGQRAVLVLDNAASTSQVAPLLPGEGSCLVLVTSRRHLGDLPGAVTPVLLDVLPPEQATGMFTRLAPRAAGSLAEVAEVVELAGFLPLAISLLARLFARHQSWTLADLAAETRAGLLALAAENDSITAAFEMSYRHLDPAPQRLFCLLGLHPGTSIDGYAAAALAGTSLAEATGLLDGLHGEGLLTETGHRRYGMHDLLRRYARDHAAGLTDSQHAMERLLDYYQHTASLAQARMDRRTRPGPPLPFPAGLVAAPDLRDAGQALAWARADRVSLLACLDHATRIGQHARVIALTAALTELLRRDGPWTDAITRHTTAAQAAQRLGDRLGQANALTELGAVQGMSGDYPGAARVLEQALDIARDTGDRLGQANALIYLGVVQRVTGDYPGAAQLLEQALDIARDIGDRGDQADALNERGTLHKLTGDISSAEACHRQALELARATTRSRDEAHALAGLGRCALANGHATQARTLLRQALEIFQRNGAAETHSIIAELDALTSQGPHG